MEWSVCVTSDGSHQPGGAIYQDILANMLGSFCMGALSSVQSLHPSEHAGARQIAFLPQCHQLQPSPAVLLGLKTGFCGSLTTFSSWMLQIGRMLYGGTGIRTQRYPVQAIFCALFGVQVGMSSYQMGTFVAKFSDLRCRHAGHTRSDPNSSASPKGTEVCKPDIMREPDVCTDITADSCCIGGVVLESAPAAIASGRNEASQVTVAGCDKVQLHPSAREHVTSYSNWDAAGPHGVSARHEAPNKDGTNGTSDDAAPATCAVGPVDPPMCYLCQEMSAKTFVAHRTWKNSPGVFMAAAMLIIATTTLVSLTVTGYSDGDKEWPAVFLAGALAPLGAVVRWQLASLNDFPKKKHWNVLKWLPLGTLLANMTACAGGAVIVSTTSKFVRDDIWSSIDGAFVTGFNGSLSTWSTLAAEIYKLAQKEDSLRAFGYITGSILLAQLLILAGYAWAAWT